MPSQDQNTICTLLKRKNNQTTMDCQFNCHILTFLPQFFDNFLFMKVRKVKDFKCILFSVKCQLCSGLEKA
jgi:hypothetical protein